MLKQLCPNIMIRVDSLGDPIEVLVGTGATLAELDNALRRKYPGYRVENNLGAWSRNGSWLVIPVLPP